MNIYWYWPHPHRSASPLALAALRPGDSLTVQALASLHGEVFHPIDEYEVIRNLPDPSIPAAGATSRMIRPARLAVHRSRARSQVLRQRYDLAHIEMIVYQTDWVDLRRLRRRVPLVCQVHDVRPHGDHPRKSLETNLLRRTYRSAGNLLVFHEVLKQELIADFGVDPGYVHVIAHPLQGSDLRDPTVMRPPRPMILLFGTLRPNKGLEVLIGALTLLGTQLEADVVIAGRADRRTALDLVDRLGAMRNVRMELGYVSAERKRELFSQASWVLLPYLSFHSQSGVLADAYEYRVPMIASDVGAIGPTVRDDGTGLLVIPGDMHSLADAMMKAAGTAGFSFDQALVAAARRHDYRIVGPQLRAIYDVVTADVTRSGTRPS